MSDAAYFAGFLLMALVVLTILTIGTLIAAGVIDFGDKPKSAEEPGDSTELPEGEDEKSSSKVAA